MHEQLNAAGAAAQALSLYRSMLTARKIDDVERELIARGEAFFHVGGAGHEASAALAPWLTADDYLHCHYRDKALLLARGIAPREFFDSLLCNAASHSAGRQMSAHLSAPALNVLSIVGPVGNNALQAVGVAEEIKHRAGQPIVLCSLGDGSTQQGEVLEAIAHAVRAALPVLFLIHDNGLAISTRTGGQTFFSLPAGDADSFYGLAIHRVDGSDADGCHSAFGHLVEQVRGTRAPALCVMTVERLTDHTNADDEAAYRSADEIHRAHECADPITKARDALLARGVTQRELDELHAAVDAEVRNAAKAALDEPAPKAVHDIRSETGECQHAALVEYRGDVAQPALTMAEALRETLRSRMTADPRVTLFGQDIEDPKGDVFGVTRGLSTSFPTRVRNAPLSESTIVGTSIGRALAGGRPVAFLQFADFLPLALNQITTELASMAWRTHGGWRAPLIVMAPCGAYRPGLGPFHAHTFDGLLAHLPGIDLAMPATAADAAGMLNAAFTSERPTVLLYPKALLHSRLQMTSADVHMQFAPPGTAHHLRHGDELTIVAWGNTVALCAKAADALAQAGASVDVIDLRWLAPWDRAAVIASVRKTRKLLVVHEDNLSGGFGAEVIATVTEAIGGELMCRRVARPDTFLPCHFGNQLELLPSFRSTLAAAAAMLEMGLQWQPLPEALADRQVIHAIGSSPADQTVEVVELPAAVGQAVVAGQTIASLEADKAVVDLASPVDGVVDQWHVQVGDRVAVDTPLMTLRVAAARARQPVAEAQAQPRLSPRTVAATLPRKCLDNARPVLLQGLGCVRGSARLHNRELAALLPTLTPREPDGDGIFERTGIESRSVAGPGQDAVCMATGAAYRALAEAGISAADLSLIICSTSTPAAISPSTACQVLQRLAPGRAIPAYDVLAACSGYLYALAQAWDFLQQRPDGHVLVLTSELMRSVIDPHDPQTSPIFGDAATATVLSCGEGAGDGDSYGHGGGEKRRGLARLQRPQLSAVGDGNGALGVPLPGTGAFVHMDGKRIFGDAIREMSAALSAACADSGLALSELDMIVPHQANGRLIDAMRARLKLPAHKVWNEIRHQGNTSSSSIPLALDTVLRRAGQSPVRIGICAFGAGYTSGAALLSTSPSAGSGLDQFSVCANERTDIKSLSRSERISVSASMTRA